MSVMCSFLYGDCDIPASPPASVSVSFLSVLTHAFLAPCPPSSAEYLPLCPPAQVSQLQLNTALDNCKKAKLLS